LDRSEGPCREVTLILWKPTSGGKAVKTSTFYGNSRMRKK
jgi:hypothetical protein